MIYLRTSVMLISLLFLGFDCSGKQPIPQPVPVKPQPTPIVTGTNYCDKAQENLLRLNCVEGHSTKKGKPFAQFCRETQENGIFINPKCLSEITDCGQVDSCTPTK